MSNRRKQIILSLKSNYVAFDGNDIDKRIKFVKWQSVLNIFIVVFSAGFVLFGIITDFFGYHLVHWEKSGILILALLSLSSVLRLPKSIVELKLLKHYRKIQESDLQNAIAKELDDELETEIDKLNNLTIYKVFSIIMMILLFIAVFYLFLNRRFDYWQYLKAPFFLFYFLGIYNLYIINRRIQNNVDEYESFLIKN